MPGTRPPHPSGERRRRLAKPRGDVEHGLIRRQRSANKISEDLDPSFNATQFSLQFVYHMFYPFSIPVVAAVEGCQANFVLSFFPPSTFAFMTALLMPSLFWVGLILFAVAAAGAPEGVAQEPSFLRDWTVRMAVGYQAVRCAVIAIKYSYVPPKVYGIMMRAEFVPSWAYNQKMMLVAAWLDPSRDILHRELASASARRQIDTARYHITVEPSMRAYTHDLLKEVLTEGDPEPAAVIDDSGDMAGTGVAVHDSKVGPGPGQVAPKASARTSGPMVAWEKRLLRRGKVAIADMAVAVQTAASRDPYVRPNNALGRSFGTATLLLSIPYILAAVRGQLFTSVAPSAMNVAAHVCLFLPSVFNAGSQLAFFAIAIFDYARRAAGQMVLTRLARPVQEGLITGKVNVLFPFATTRAQQDAGSADQAALSQQMEELSATPDMGPGGGLQAVEEVEEEEEPGHTAVEMGTAISQDHDSPPDDAVGLEEEEDGEAEKLIEAVAVSTVGADASSHPPIIDVTRPSNAFAWIRLREVLGDMGLRFQKRMQLYIAVGCMLVLLLDISAVVTAAGSSYTWGQDTEADLLVLYASSHSAIMLIVISACVALGAAANSQAAKQAEALMHSQVELEEVAREMQVVVEHRALATVHGHRPRALSRAGAMTPQTALGGMDRQHSLESEVSGEGAPLRIRADSDDGGSVAGSVAGTARGGMGDASSSHNVAKAVAGMSLQQLNGLLGGLRSAVTSLTTVITALQINQAAHPVRVMGFPATFNLLRLLFVATFLAMSAIVGL